MGFFDSLRMQMMIQISRPGYFPGNVIEGNVIVNVMAPVEYYGIHLILEGKETVLVQHCRQVPNGGGAVLIEEHRRHGHHHHHRNEEVVVAVADGGFHEEWYVEEREAIITRRVVTLAGSYSAVLASRDNGQRPGFFTSISNHIQDMGRPKQYLQPGNYVFPFQLALPAGIPASFCSGASVGDFWDRPVGANPLRSRDDIAAAIGYWLKGDVEVPNGRDVTQRVPFSVYAPMPSRQWQNPCPAVVDRFWDLTCCCCIPKGKVSARLAVDRTVIALDRDAVPVRVAVDNTQGEVKLRSVKATLVSKCRVNMPGIGNRSQRNTVAITTVPLDLAPGQRREVDGVLRFSPACVPTIHGALVHIDYEVVLELDVEGASNERQAFPVVVAQTVDMSDAMPVVDFAAPTFYRPFDPSTPHQVYYAPPPGAANVPNFVVAPSGAAFMTAAQPTITIFPNPTGFTVATGPASPQYGAAPAAGGYGTVAYGSPVGAPASAYVAM